MSLDFEKVTYVDDETVIGADNLNDIQDAILDLLDAADTVIDTSVSPNILREEYVVELFSNTISGRINRYGKFILRLLLFARYVWCIQPIEY